jgi:hypothetical protein
MKNLILVILSVLFLTSCTGDDQTPKSQDQSLSIVDEFLNSYNYEIVSDGGVDTLSLIKVDSVNQVKNYPIITHSGDTSSVKIIGHTDISLFFVKVKRSIGGYSKQYNMVIANVKNKKPMVVCFIDDPNRVKEAVSDYKLNDEESIKLKKQYILDNQNYINE